MSGITIKHLPKGWFAKPSPMALGINRTLYRLRVPITWGLGLSWSIALVSELHIFHVEIMIICEIGALIMLIVLAGGYHWRFDDSFLVCKVIIGDVDDWW